MLAAIKTAKLLGLGPDDAVITIATDGAGLYGSERAKTIAGRFGGEFTEVDAAEVFGEHLASVSTDHVLECTEQDRNRIFNLGYYTWVEQQGTPLEVFEARRSQRFWQDLRSLPAVWDELIGEFNDRTGLACRADDRPAGAARSAARSCRSPRRGRGGARTPPPTTATTCCSGCRSLGADAADRRPEPADRLRLAVRLGRVRRGPRDGRRRRAPRWCARSTTPSRAVDGTGFRVTPFARSPGPERGPRLQPRGRRVGEGRDGQRGRQPQGPPPGRHPAAPPGRRAARRGAGAARPPLAIASCGNAALGRGHAGRGRRLAARGVRAHLGRRRGSSARLARAGRARSSVCPRVPGDPPGDPCVHRFRAAVAAGAVPFAVQGPENALCLDTGRTIGWEVIEGLGHFLDRVVRPGRRRRAGHLRGPGRDRRGHPPAAPRRADRGLRAAGAGLAAGPAAVGLAAAPQRWASACGRGRTSPARSADGILDDETYDWVGVVQGMAASGGSPVVVTEAQIAEAHDLACRSTGIPVSPTGSAGLAGLLALRPRSTTASASPSCSPAAPGRADAAAGR